MNKNLKEEGYKNLLTELKDIISNGKNKAYKTVDNVKVQTYWQIGERVVREELKYKNRADYEKYLVDNLAIDLDVSRRLLYQIVKFYRLFSIVHALRAQLSWKHYTVLIGIEKREERNFYENKTINNSWSYRELEHQIKNKLYQNTNQKEVLDISKSIIPRVIDIAKIFKPEYDLNFLNISENHQEKELENKIVSNVGSFLKELGSDFMFLEQQMPILIDGEKHFVDLVFFNRSIPCIILVDLKVGKFDSRDIGQMNKYVNYFRYNRQYAYEQDAIGLVICRDADHEEIFYALGGLEEKIFVAKYKAKLPSEERIKKAIKKIGN